MLEQVSATALHIQEVDRATRRGDVEPCDDSEKEAAQSAAVMEAAKTLASILGDDADEDNRLRFRERQPLEKTPVVREGDGIGARLLGLLGGFPLPDATVYQAGDSLTTIDGLVNVAAVEAHMKDLVQFPGRRREGMPPKPELSNYELDTALAPLKTHAVPLEVLQQRLLASAFTNMLPPGVQAAHASEILSRHTLEHLSCDIMMQVWPLGSYLTSYVLFSMHHCPHLTWIGLK
jgi:hypothetical protein